MIMKRILIQDTNGNLRKELRDFHVSLTSQLRERSLADAAQVVIVADIGIYNKGLVAKILPEGFIYGDLEAGHIPEIIEKTIQRGERVDALALDKKNKQMRIVLRNCGRIDPENFEDYLMCDGYQGLVGTGHWAGEGY